MGLTFTSSASSRPPPRHTSSRTDRDDVIVEVGARAQRHARALEAASSSARASARVEATASGPRLRTSAVAHHGYDPRPAPHAGAPAPLRRRPVAETAATIASSISSRCSATVTLLVQDRPGGLRDELNELLAHLEHASPARSVVERRARALARCARPRRRRRRALGLELVGLALRLGDSCAGLRARGREASRLRHSRACASVLVGTRALSSVPPRVAPARRACSPRIPCACRSPNATTQTIATRMTNCTTSTTNAQRVRRDLGAISAKISSKRPRLLKHVAHPLPVAGASSARSTAALDGPASALPSSCVARESARTRSPASRNGATSARALGGDLARDPPRAARTRRCVACRSVSRRYTSAARCACARAPRPLRAPCDECCARPRSALASDSVGLQRACVGGLETSLALLHDREVRQHEHPPQREVRRDDDQHRRHDHDRVELLERVEVHLGRFISVTPRHRALESSAR